MTDWYAPTPTQILKAFKDHGLKVTAEKDAATRGRPWKFGIRGLVDHHTAGTNSLRYMLNLQGNLPYANSLISKDGSVHVLSFMSVWGTGDGGPWGWAGIPKNLAHLYVWNTEVESLGRSQDFTAQQLESLGRQNAALLKLCGLPPRAEINHKDWTNGTGGVAESGHLPGNTGRKVDTRYDAVFLRANTAKYELKKPLPVTTPVVLFKEVTPGRKNGSILTVQKALVKVGIPLDYSDSPGTYGPKTTAAYAIWQRQLGYTGKDADGVAGEVSLTKLGNKAGFKVVMK